MTKTSICRNLLLLKYLTRKLSSYFSIPVKFLKSFCFLKIWKNKRLSFCIKNFILIISTRNNYRNHLICSYFLICFRFENPFCIKNLTACPENWAYIKKQNPSLTNNTNARANILKEVNVLISCSTKYPTLNSLLF